MIPIFIGLGRRGGDILEGLTLPQGIEAKIRYADTDREDLQRRDPGSTLFLGSQSDDEEHRRNDPSFAFDAALSRRPQIETLLSSADVVVLVAGLGGGTGAGGSRAIARIARESALPVVTLLTHPFELEGESRIYRARITYRELMREAALSFSFHQDLLLRYVGKATRVRHVIGVADEIIRQASIALAAIIADSATSEDFRALTNVSGTALFGHGVSDNSDGLLEATDLASISPFLQGVSSTNARGFALSVLSRAPLEPAEIEKAMQKLGEQINVGGCLRTTQHVVPGLEHEVEVLLSIWGEFDVPSAGLGEAVFLPGPSG